MSTPPVFPNRLIRAAWLLLVLASLGSAPPPTGRSRATRLVLHMTETENRIRAQLDPADALSGYYSLDAGGFSLFASPDGKKSGRTEWYVAWADVDEFIRLAGSMPPADMMKLLARKKRARFGAVGLPPYVPHPARPTRPPVSPTRPLQNVRVAIDPGHVAGDIEMGRIEQKFIQIARTGRPGTAREITIVEGYLTLTTALFLRDRLVDAGAEVMLTRDRPNATAFGKSFADWLAEDRDSVLAVEVLRGRLSAEAARRLRSAGPRDLFNSFFRDHELRERARRINSFRPDLTVIIHYNVDESNVGWKNLSRRNYSMAFVGGRFDAGDMAKPENRYEFLRLALTGDNDRSIELSGCVVSALSTRLKIPCAARGNADYLMDRCLPTGRPGVFVRNLALTRLVHGPLVYGETLYQDNEAEAIRLMDRSAKVRNLAAPRRVREAAEAYYAGILAYLQAPTGPDSGGRPSVSSPQAPTRPKAQSGGRRAGSRTVHPTGKSRRQTPSPPLTVPRARSVPSGERPR